MFQNILFDLDGTLTDPKEGICKGVQYALRRFGIEEPDIDKLTPFIGPPLTTSFMDFYHFSEQKAKEAVPVYREYFGTIGKFENEVYDGIPELLDNLKKKGIHLAVASSKPQIFVEQILEHFCLNQYFDVVVGSELDGTRVEKEEVVKEALKQLKDQSGLEKINSDNTAMVGDRKFDLIGAKEHNLAAVGVEYGYAIPGELQQEGADFIAHTVADLEAFLLEGV